MSSLLFFAAFYALLVVLPPFLAGAGLGPGETAVVLGAFGIAGLVARPLAGRATDDYGPHRVIVVGVLLFVAGTLTLLATRSPVVLTVMRGVQAAGYVAFTTGATSLVAVVSDPAAHARVMARFGTAANVAMAGAPALTGVLIETLAPHTLLVTTSAVALLAMFPLLGARGGGDMHPRPAPAEAFRATGRSKMAHVAVSAVFGMGFGAFLQFMPVLAYSRGHAAGLGFAVFSGSIVATRIVWARLARGAASRREVALALFFVAGGLTTYAVAGGITSLVAASAALAAACGVLHPTLIALFLASYEQTGRAVGRFYVAFDTGIGAGAWLLAAPASRWGVEAIFLGSAAVVAVTAVGVLRARSWGAAPREAAPIDSHRDGDSAPAGAAQAGAIRAAP